MSKQIFKNEIPKEILFNLIDKISNINNNYYLINKISYKKAEYLNLLEPFYSNIKKYYHESKQFYITRKQNYNSFLTILRHICKANSINYLSKILYDKSKYEIVYYIYI